MYNQKKKTIRNSVSRNDSIDIWQFPLCVQLVLAFYLRLMYEAVDIAHPIFGVLFHEMAALFSSGPRKCQCSMTTFSPVLRLMFTTSAT